MFEVRLIFGSGLVQLWFSFGSALVQIWCMGLIWFSFASASVQFWFSFGSGSVHVWFMGQIWFSFGSALVQLWFRFGSALVQLWQPPRRAAFKKSCIPCCFKVHRRSPGDGSARGVDLRPRPSPKEAARPPGTLRSLSRSIGSLCCAPYTKSQPRRPTPHPFSRTTPSRDPIPLVPRLNISDPKVQYTPSPFYLRNGALDR